ncbi:hypothetical protein KIW84_015060 [Lathyrus oleraceus]|uniref:Uncharacterized protein n=1 Tax=Pisum sativum TaxID=3888 RepID=A0A9D5BPH8_PEA|nr:hypothetical protein KIW84_015060 [Pisum sativum]
MTPLVLDSEEGVGESCEEDLGLNLNGLGEEEKKEGFVEGRERVMIDIGKLDKFPTPWHLQILKRPCIPDLLMASLGMKVCSESLSTSLVLPSGAPIAERDGSNEYADYQPGLLNTTHKLINDVENIDIVFHLGDMPYANGYISQ